MTTPICKAPARPSFPTLPTPPKPKTSPPDTLQFDHPPIALLSTGGTFEKAYDPTAGGLGFTVSGLAAWKAQCRMPDNTRLDIPFLVDSLDMTDAQRTALCARIRDCPEAHVVVVHGTDTMVASAQEAMRARRPEQVVVFTGAMIPASCSGSDALFNLGMAMAAVQCQPPGVWVACSGRVFAADAVEKNRAQGRFVPLTAHPRS